MCFLRCLNAFVLCAAATASAVGNFLLLSTTSDFGSCTWTKVLLSGLRGGQADGLYLEEV